MKSFLLSVPFCLVAALATASTINPVSYDMPNGYTGTFTYFDDSYSGSGNTSQPGAALTGGLGDLTDGVIATQNWNLQPGLYVGWNINPVIVFRFDRVQAFSAMTFHFDDADGAGGVRQPASVTVNGTSYAVPINPGPAPFAFTADLTGVEADTLSVQLFRSPSAGWVFLSEVTFEGTGATAVPLPAGGLLLLTALGGLAFARRRRG